MIIPPAYTEMIAFLAAGVTPTSLIAFRPSTAAKQRVADLLQREKREGLTPEEQAELAHYLHLEHLMHLVKARARRYRQP